MSNYLNNDNDEEDCTIYIEELKSDDPNLKINAVTKIIQIAKILGQNRVREELIPYLIEIIEELDNEEDFLTSLCEQIVQLNDFIGGKAYSHLLIAPLELLASMEENIIRQKAVNSLIQISNNQESQFFSTHFFSMIKQLAGWDNYPSRISACSLIGATYFQFQEAQREDLMNSFEKLCKDDTPMVRRTASQNIEEKQQTQLFFKEKLLPMWLNLLKDNVDSVKVKSIEISPKLITRLSKSDVAEKFVKNIKEILTAKGKSWRIRYAIAEIICDLILNVENDCIQKEILPIYEILLKDSEHEVRSITLIKVPELCQHLPSSILTTNLLPVLNGLVQDTSQHVRSSLGEIICKIANFFEQNSVISGIIPIVESLLKDETLDVRLSLINNIQLINQYIGNENVKKYILPAFQSIQNDKQWRFRLVFVEFIPNFLQQIGFEEFKEQFLEFVKIFAFDHYSAIREQVFANFLVISKTLGYPAIKNIFFDLVNQLIKSNNYIYRVTATKSIGHLIDVIPKNDLNEIFEILQNNLFDDKVPNVKINLLKLYNSIQEKLNPSVRNKFIQKTKILLKDNDADLSYFASLI
ncbi:hypothetical protein IMG5_162070 [Ichthyophthirius multifiliis]|uniref:Uncharacterized protein n=1 Tax=Ichthyophthirius multifiliis TaxID=5932 RepID=G0R053_ICHMU|nr:hypothetical protein IMG5_162070 [Ichthyophthirius multifiliis]EGR29152.1 hypothetical protein IMG5_162070 [Ichthyophthirius multifiliis]|eukprot:XP_004030388.1 hypothetical protein IMG5_162070 [Ichthyophthirius multifiliis]